MTAIKMDLPIFIFASFAITGVGLLLGFIELQYLDQLFADKSFTTRFFSKLLVYGILFFIVILILFPIAGSLELDTHPFDKRVWAKYATFLMSYTSLSTVLQLSVSLVISLFYAEISEFIGQRTLVNFLKGKYHTPTEEERIFMFLDMKSSTTIAEKLGHVDYFKLLQAYYECFTDAIVHYEGEIYQYVGDEIILSWNVQHNRGNAKCLDCFFAMKKSLQQKSDWFQAQFGFIPTFKAGIHVGKVSTGEIGVLKKDIIFTGDVLNATARIQSLCNTYGVDLLVSDTLKDQLNIAPPYESQFVDYAILRGKEEKMGLYTIGRDQEVSK